jgi:hypothetical protein
MAAPSDVNRTKQGRYEPLYQEWNGRYYGANGGFCWGRPPRMQGSIRVLVVPGDFFNIINPRSPDGSSG